MNDGVSETTVIWPQGRDNNLHEHPLIYYLLGCYQALRREWSHNYPNKDGFQKVVERAHFLIQASRLDRWLIATGFDRLSAAFVMQI
jgi:hypothetical protein